MWLSGGAPWAGPLGYTHTRLSATVPQLQRLLALSGAAKRQPSFQQKRERWEKAERPLTTRTYRMDRQTPTRKAGKRILALHAALIQESGSGSCWAESTAGRRGTGPGRPPSPSCSPRRAAGTSAARHALPAAGPRTRTGNPGPALVSTRSPRRRGSGKAGSLPLAVLGLAPHLSPDGAAWTLRHP